jgi:hypothetical protein
MQIDKPTWYLKSICPHCGQGFPAFYKCPDCSYLTVVCLETSDAFIDPRRLEQGFADICPSCNRVKTEDFVLADPDDIIKGGFTRDDYE